MSEKRPNRWTVGIVAGLVLVLLVGIRATCELGMMREYGPDAQMAIWEMYLVAKLALWLLGGALAAGLLIATWPRRWGAVASGIVLLIWAVAICLASRDYNTARHALADARRHATPSDRLRELVHFDGIQAGYELDNRLASNPSTPPDSLRELSQRPEQPGTRICLARNPSTPPDVLEQLHQAPK